MSGIHPDRVSELMDRERAAFVDLFWSRQISVEPRRGEASTRAGSKP